MSHTMREPPMHPEDPSDLGRPIPHPSREAVEAGLRSPLCHEHLHHEWNDRGEAPTEIDRVELRPTGKARWLLERLDGVGAPSAPPDAARLAEIAARLKAATPGPWPWEPIEVLGKTWPDEARPSDCTPLTFGWDGEEGIYGAPADLSFIAHAVEDVAYLLEIARGVRAPSAAPAGPWQVDHWPEHLNPWAVSGPGITHQFMLEAEAIAVCEALNRVAVPRG